MKLSLAGAAFVRHHEGFVAQWYLDPVNIPTIGVGFTWGSTSFREWWTKNRPGEAFRKGVSMTREEADNALQFMCAKEYGAAVGNFLGKTVAQHVFDGMTSPVYNLGTGSLKWTWAAAAKQGNLKDAANRLRTTGTTAKGVKLNGLVTRRKEEAELLELGDYAMGNAVNEPMADGVLVRGERGTEVAALQKALAAIGFYTGTVDGIFGFGTEAAVLAFQRGRGLKADGYAGEKTLAQVQPAKVEPTKPTPSTTPAKPPTKSPAAIIVAAVLALGGAAYAFLKSQGLVP